MSKLGELSQNRIFYFFEQISAIPRGSGNMKKIADYCCDFAQKHNLKYIKDEANNVVIYKNASQGYENSTPVILQGHLDMVCQKEENCTIDFKEDSLDIYIDGDFIKAKGTTLGADNGIAIAMILSILESDKYSHPAIEAVFTTDEEIGLIGAGKLDKSILSGKKMINIDSEDLTVSCAGGCDLRATLPIKRVKQSGTEISIVIDGLKGGHSGAAIDKGRVNADMLAGRILNHLKQLTYFSIISINGGDKGNAIPNRCEIKICAQNPEIFKTELSQYAKIIKTEISVREENFTVTTKVFKTGCFNVFDTSVEEKLIYSLLCAPNGVIEMSAEIDRLVETSLNLGILKTENENIILHFALRSNKKTGLLFIEEKTVAFFKMLGFSIETFGHYPPWEYKTDSVLRPMYIKTHLKHLGVEPKVKAIHAGLECGLFASAIDGLDCIAIGPELYDIHTVNEKLSISSTLSIFNIITEILENLK